MRAALIAGDVGLGRELGRVMGSVLGMGAEAFAECQLRWAREFRGRLHVAGSQGSYLLGTS